MANPKQLSFMLDASLYKQSLAFQDLGKILDNLLNSGVEEFRVKLLLNEANIIEKITDDYKSHRVKVKHLNRSQSYLSKQLTGEYGRKNKIVLDGKVLIINHPVYRKVWLAISDASSDFFKKPFRDFHITIHPRSAPLILTTAQMEDLLISFQREYSNFSIRVKQIGQRARIRSIGAVKNIETDRRWTDLNIDEAFSEAREAGQWLTDVLIEYDISSKYSAVKIGRFGEFVFKGASKIAFDHFINYSAKFGEERYKFLKNRNRSKETNYTSKPFYINFNFPVFNSKDQFKKFSKTLQKIPSTTFTTLHSNPYFHASLVDYIDGSNYEVVIMNANYLTIIPQGRATVRSLQKLCSCVFSNFREGEIVETINES
jgi:hypothetical protein